MCAVSQKPGAFLGIQESNWDCFVRSICNDFPGESVSGKIEVEQRKRVLSRGPEIFENLRWLWIPCTEFLVWDTCGIIHSCHRVVSPLMLMSCKVCSAFCIQVGTATLDILAASLINSSSFWILIMKAALRTYIRGYSRIVERSIYLTIYKWNDLTMELWP